MRWSSKQVQRLLYEMAAQAQASSWSDRRAEDRARVLSAIMRGYGWVRRDRHPPEVANTAWLIAMNAKGSVGPALRLQVLGCLFAESHTGGLFQTHRRRWLGLWSKPQTDNRPTPSPGEYILREQFARLIDQSLTDANAATVFGTTRPVLKHGRLINPALCCPNDIAWLRNALGSVTNAH